MFLHYLVLIDDVPPVSVRICHIVVITGFRTSPWVFACRNPLVNDVLRELRDTADIGA